MHPVSYHYNYSVYIKNRELLLHEYAFNWKQAVLTSLLSIWNCLHKSCRKEPCLRLMSRQFQFVIDKVIRIQTLLS